MDWRRFVSVDGEICHGRPCVTGTRVMVSVVLDNLAAGLSVEEITQSYPGVSADAIHAAMAYAADLARDRIVSLPPHAA